jgi:CxxC-x17-CxxC domain-containing protein
VAILSAPQAGGNAQHFTRVETRAICSQCGKETTVPFRPTQGRPIFCRECFTQKRNTATA